MSDFLKYIKFQRRDLASLLLALLIGTLFGTGLMCIILALDSGSWFPLGTTMALGGLLVFTIICYFQYYQQFMLALSMGRTRKEFLLFFGISNLLYFLAALVLVPLIEWVEGQLYGLLFPDAWGEFRISDFISWLWLLPSAPLLTLLTMFLGSLYSRYGKRFNVVMYILWMGSCILLPQAINHIDTLPLPLARFFDLLFSIPPLGWLAVAVLAIGAMAYTVVRLGLKQAVR